MDSLFDIECDDIPLTTGNSGEDLSLLKVKAKGRSEEQIAFCFYHKANPSMSKAWAVENWKETHPTKEQGLSRYAHNYWLKMARRALGRNEQ